MRAAGERVHLTWDSRQAAEPGDYLRTRTTGRTYLIDEVRVQLRGKYVGRQHLTCTVMPTDHQVESDAIVHTIAWYSRDRRR